MKKVKSFATHPVTLLAATAAVLYFGWKLVVAAGLEMMVAGFLLGIITIFFVVLHVGRIFYGAREVRGSWKKKQCKSAAFAAIYPMVSVIVLGAMIVLPLIYGIEMIHFGVLLVIVTTMAQLLLYGIWDILIFYFGTYNIPDKNVDH